ncbi:AAA family ATPase [Cronobacter turicensis]|nr:ATP-binding protein [Cronobacter dublinensis]EKF2290920.1 ATP-binding protein [Cronobacter dublinensis]EKF2295853.1 ATP-binding protein [Cronobacter dublinensis]EKM0137055.1 ATP-binding protein [Cronobacter dublinensis]EKM0149446.1 ATP-binding protein [Cronobacter dublinensis]
MRIKSLETYNSHSKLRINRIEFDSLTLMVGASGVGKTQILRSINKIKSIANGDSVSGFSWIVEFNAEGNDYYWSGEFEALADYDEFTYGMFNFDDDDKIEPRILAEEVKINGVVVVSRNGDDIVYKDSKTVKLASTVSIVHHLREEDDVSVIHNSFSRVVEVAADELQRVFPRKNKDISESEDLTINEIREKSFSLSAKLYLCQEKQPEYFQQIKNSFVEIFPYIEDVKVVKVDTSTFPFFINSVYVLKVKERGIEEWISHNSMSTGMLKTLVQLAYLHLSPTGTVFLIDEFENGFGVNCINDITDVLIHHGNDVQFILTSHHPYIINNIPLDNWKIVSRKAGVVDNYSADHFNLQESNHEAFTKLINLSVYFDGADR